MHAQLSLPILGGTAIGDDMGYGAPRYLDAPQVKEAAEALAALPVDELRQRFKPAELEEAVQAALERIKALAEASAPGRETAA